MMRLGYHYSEKTRITAKIIRILRPRDDYKAGGGCNGVLKLVKFTETYNRTPQFDQMKIAAKRRLPFLYSSYMESFFACSVYWVPVEDYRHMELAGGMDQVLKILCDGTAHECWMHLEDGRYQEYLY